MGKPDPKWRWHERLCRCLLTIMLPYNCPSKAKKKRKGINLEACLQLATTCYCMVAYWSVSAGSTMPNPLMQGARLRHAGCYTKIRPCAPKLNLNRPLNLQYIKHVINFLFRNSASYLGGIGVSMSKYSTALQQRCNTDCDSAYQPLQYMCC